MRPSGRVDAATLSAAPPWLGLPISLLTPVLSERETETCPRGETRACPNAVRTGCVRFRGTATRDRTNVVPAEADRYPDSRALGRGARTLYRGPTSAAMLDAPSGGASPFSGALCRIDLPRNRISVPTESTLWDRVDPTNVGLRPPSVAEPDRVWRGRSIQGRLGRSAQWAWQRWSRDRARALAPARDQCMQALFNRSL